MPSLITRKKSRPGQTSVEYEVRAVYLPFFVAANQTLLEHVDRRLQEKFPTPGASEEEMSRTVVDAIMETHPIQGLREVLEAIAAMEPEKRIPQDQVQVRAARPEKKPPPVLEVVGLDEELP